ncbi:M81 family metallopeptidase [Miniphocaeibacter massiliensis]|uniref:M81 family metallopeptidase n=1 Tax=Miniphocaeibacter massiliensis TaxID=2041841 RepID=UPI000C1B8F05|nr:M81 family metallopeptidase [Miniphocaeibacter massiliensis]
MKILIGNFGHEANTFASKDASFEEFTRMGYYKGEELIPHYRGKPSYIGGMIKSAEEEGVEVIPTVDVLNAAPTLSMSCVNKVMDDIISVIKKNKDDIDGICFGLHGAGVARGIDDLESYVLKKIKEIVGNDIPIVSTLDLHANISNEMVELSDGLFGVKEYPHIDTYEAGYLAFKTLVKILKGDLKTKMAVKHIPILLPLSAGFTQREPLLSINKHIKEYVKENDLIDASLFHGFPYADVEFASTSIVVVGDENSNVEKAAGELAEYVWKERYGFIPEINSPAEAMNKAENFEGEGYIVINESSDNPGGGTPGDGTFLLREMLKRNREGTVFGFIYDIESLEEIHKHKIGEKIDLKLGGKTEKIHGEPIEIKDAIICNLSDGLAICTTPMLKGLPMNFKKAARIKVGNVDIILTGDRGQTLDDRPFLITGADLNDYRYVGLKSANHFRGYFQDKAAMIIPTDPPGIMSADLSVFEYKKVTMPKFPLNKDIEF